VIFVVSRASEGAYPSPPARIFGRGKHAAESIGRDSFEILQPPGLDQKGAVIGWRKLSIGESMPPLYGEGPAPELVFASYFYPDSLHFINAGKLYQPAAVVKPGRS
jgi:hypothetical protein